jgi:hypothetical protein
MSVIDNNPFGTPFEPSLPITTLPNSGGFGGAAPQQRAGADNISFGPYPPSLPIASPVSGGECAPSSSAGGSWSFSNVMNAIGNAINSLLAQLGNSLPGSGTTAGSTSPTTAGQTFFANATASSNGDPHLAFDGTTSAGASVEGKWDSMASHADLLSSDSFAGGYRVATQVTEANAKGVTQNASATVTTAGGATSVTMNANGSYAVTENGASIALKQGQATSLGNGETVTLEADGSLTVSDRSATGGSISTTLRSNGDGGVNVSNTASEIDLGGYLVNKSDGAWNANPPQPVPQSQTSALSAQMETAYEAQQNQQLYGASATPQAGLQGFDQFDPESESTSLENIALV